LSDSETLRATPEELSGYARRRAAINEMRRAACFRLAQLSRPVAGSSERRTLKLPSRGDESTEVDESLESAPRIGRVKPNVDGSDVIELPMQNGKPAPREPELPPPASTRAARPSAPTDDEPEIPSWLLRRNQISDSATTLGLLLIDFADSNIRRHLDLARALLTAKSLEEAIERHDSYMKSSLQIFEEQAAELQSLTNNRKAES
jgi:hypothetical protein